MSEQSKLIEWRSEEIAKIILRKSSFNLRIEKFPSEVFDFFVTLLDRPKYRFAVEVKSNSYFSKRINVQLNALIRYRKAGMIDLPVLLLKVNEADETGEVDFLILPSKTKRLLIKRQYNFKVANERNLNLFIDKIIQWWDEK